MGVRRLTAGALAALALAAAAGGVAQATAVQIGDVNYQPSLVAPVAFSLTSNGASAPFTPHAGKPFHVTFDAGAGTASCTLLENVDGSGYVTMTIAGSPFPAYSYTGAGFTDVEIESQAAVPVELSCASVTGTVPGTLTQ